MDFSLREVHYFVTCVQTGSFTAAAARLYVSQAAVSRTIASLERTAGRPLLRRVPTGCVPTQAGAELLGAAQSLLAEARDFSNLLHGEARTLRLGYAWAALGRRTIALQRRWAEDHAGVQLELIRNNTPTAGLAEGLCEVAVLRRLRPEDGFASTVVGIEQRLAAFASDDATWARRRSLRMAEIGARTVAVDTRGGTTDRSLFDARHAPEHWVETMDVDSWLDLISTGRAVGTTAESTAHHHQRHGIRYLPISDGPPIEVSLAWRRGREPAGLQELIDLVRDLYGYTPGVRD